MTRDVAATVAAHADRARRDSHHAIGLRVRMVILRAVLRAA